VKLSAILVLLGLLVGCGGGSSSKSNINGNWSATLTNSDATPAFDFSTSFTQNSGSTLTVTHFNFTTTTPCFASDETETGGFAMNGDFNGNVAGAFQMNVTSGTPSGNILALQGTVKNNTISGTWVLSGASSGCTGSGNFTMTRM
jgi:hypothetical protein